MGRKYNSSPLKCQPVNSAQCYCRPAHNAHGDGLTIGARLAHDAGHTYGAGLAHSAGLTQGHSGTNGAPGVLRARPSGETPGAEWAQGQCLEISALKHAQPSLAIV